jgi:hypothetical protein
LSYVNAGALVGYVLSGRSVPGWQRGFATQMRALIPWGHK